MNELRDIIQTKLEEITGLTTTTEVPDDMLEKGITYFSYTLQKTYVNGDYGKNFTYRIYLNGYIKRIQDDEENTLLIVDEISSEIEEKLKDLNIKCSFQDVTVIDNIRKINVRGETMYNELNKGLI